MDCKKGRCIIGNPPYGTKNILSVQFYNKSCELGDYISFILPISQLNNNQQMYKFDMIYSEDLGKRVYSGVQVHCCLNIYKRPTHSILNEKPNYKLKDMSIFEVRLRNKIVDDYDIRIMAWGGGKKTQGKQLGCEVDFPEQYAKEFCIKIHNEKYKEQIIHIIKNTNWAEIYPMTATPNLLQWQVYKYIKEQIPEIA